VRVAEASEFGDGFILAAVDDRLGLQSGAGVDYPQPPPGSAEVVDDADPLRT
jgi:hypothetical protein